MYVHSNLLLFITNSTKWAEQATLLLRYYSTTEYSRLAHTKTSLNICTYYCYYFHYYYYYNDRNPTLLLSYEKLWKMQIIIDWLMQLNFQAKQYLEKEKKNGEKVFKFHTFSLHKLNSLPNFAIIWWWKKIMIFWDCFNKKIVGWFHLNDTIHETYGWKWFGVGFYIDPLDEENKM